VEEYTIALIQIGVPLALLLVTYAIGSRIEKRHYARIREQEQRWRNLPAITFRNPPAAWVVDDSMLLSGSVVISVDYFKRFLAGLRMFFGGRVKSYESLMDRARREALIRLKVAAVEQGCHALINVRMETTRMANARGNQKLAGLEVLAYGTALKLRNRPA
jgi:uncharacterized protein YbjQ (UPF0145 family)